MCINTPCATSSSTHYFQSLSSCNILHLPLILSVKVPLPTLHQPQFHPYQAQLNHHYFPKASYFISSKFKFVFKTKNKLHEQDNQLQSSSYPYYILSLIIAKQLHPTNNYHDIHVEDSCKQHVPFLPDFRNVSYSGLYSL